jgi:gas vesicle protein
MEGENPMSSDRDEFGAFLVGFIVGGLTGAVVSLLFAPQSGEETRALIRDKSIEIRDKAAESAEEALDRAEAAAAEARVRAEELAKIARARAEELGKEVRTRGEELGREVRTRGEGALEAVRKPASKKPGSDTPAAS